MMLLSNGCMTTNPPLPNPPITTMQDVENLVEQGQIIEAESILDQYSKTWKTQTIRGDIAAHRKQWQVAARFFQDSLNLIETTPQQPNYEEIEKIYRSFEDAQLLAGETVSSLIPPPHNPAKSFWVPPKMRIPVEFKPNGWKVEDITKRGKNAIEGIAKHLNKQNVKTATLIGHTDEIGKATYNQWLSEQRAKSVETYLQNSGVQTSIESYGKGEDEPLPLPRWKELTEDEIHQRNRRVELEMK